MYAIGQRSGGSFWVIRGYNHVLVRLNWAALDLKNGVCRPLAKQTADLIAHMFGKRY